MIKYLYSKKTNRIKGRAPKFNYACIELHGKSFCVHIDGETFQKLILDGHPVIGHKQHMELLRKARTK